MFISKDLPIAFLSSLDMAASQLKSIFDYLNQYPDFAQIAACESLRQVIPLFEQEIKSQRGECHLSK